MTCNEEYFIQTWMKNSDLLWELLSYLPFLSFPRSYTIQLHPQLHNAIFPPFLQSLQIRAKLRVELNCLLVLGTSWNFLQRCVA